MVQSVTVGEVEMKRTRPTHMTAIKRNTVSLPIRENLMRELTDPCKRVLDYGCGRGYDADRLGMFKYDPHFFPDKPAGEFGQIYCGYVLNCLNKAEGRRVIAEIKTLLTQNGNAWIVVRRDHKEDNPNQRTVELTGDCSHWYSNSKYAIYCIWKGGRVEVK
jgi:hypothetical protein